MKYKNKLMILALVCFAFFQSCKQKDQDADADDKNKPNRSRIAVDESLQPIFDEELYIFNALYTDDKAVKDVNQGVNNNPHPISGVKSKIIYAPENEAINLFLEDSVRVAIISRDLTPDEYKALQARNSRPLIERFAIDAIALIVNSASNDTTITVSEIKKMLNGDTKQNRNIVFDNPNSGLVRYLKQLAGNSALKQKNIYALKSNKEVIKYVSVHPDAIGIAGFSWLNDPDKDYADAVQKVKIVSVKDDVNKNADTGYYSPSQNTLALKQYPLIRNLYILYATSKLGTEFASFLRSDRGQRIILKSGLLPDNIPNRRINITSKMKITDK
jgi:phosphate transport system substrate-binding protein